MSDTTAPAPVSVPVSSFSGLVNILHNIIIVAAGLVFGTASGVGGEVAGVATGVVGFVLNEIHVNPTGTIGSFLNGIFGSTPTVAS